MMALAGQSVATTFEWRAIEMVKAETRKTTTGTATWKNRGRSGSVSRSPAPGAAFGGNCAAGAAAENWAGVSAARMCGNTGIATHHERAPRF